MTGGPAVLLALGLAAGAAVLRPPAQGGGAPSVAMGVLVRPAAVTVGEPFTVTLRVRAPLGADIRLPVGPDSGQPVEAVDPRAVRATAAPPGTVERTAAYRLVAWDTGVQSSHLGDVVVTLDGRALRYPVSGDTVRVRSVLPADTALRTPRAARDVVLATRPWWLWALVGAAGAAVLWLIGWWWRRRRQRRLQPAPVDALVAARREFAHIEALDLLAAGEPGRHVALSVGVLRDYLAARIPAAGRSLTDPELLVALGDETAVPADRLAPLLAESDLIKFARRAVPNDRAAALGADARALVESIERRLAEQATAHAGERAA